jgi:hypothetical protein
MNKCVVSLYFLNIGSAVMFCYSFSSALLISAKGKELLGRPRRRWVDNIEMDLGEIRWGGMDWIGLAQDRDR